jgi:hypothetical protein
MRLRIAGVFFGTACAGRGSFGVRGRAANRGGHRIKTARPVTSFTIERYIYFPGHPADLPQARQDDPWSRRLQLPRAGAEDGAGGTLAALGRSGSWREIIADLNSLTEPKIAYDGKRFARHRGLLPG